MDAVVEGRGEASLIQGDVDREDEFLVEAIIAKVSLSASGRP